MNDRDSAAALQILIPHFYKLLRSERSEFFKLYDLSPTQYDVLACLDEENMNLSTLSDTLLLDSSTLVGIVDKLKKNGLIIKKVNPRDRRKNILSVTRKGREVLKSIPPFVSPTLQVVLSDLDEKEKREFIRVIEKIVKQLNLMDYVPTSRENSLKPIRVM